MPGVQERGTHTHRVLHQFIVAMSGNSDIALDDGVERKWLHLARSDCGLYVCPMIWRGLDKLSSESVCMVLASQRFAADEYIQDNGEFLPARRWGHRSG